MPADPPRWVLTTQADIDACAEALFVDHGLSSMVHRGDKRFLQFYLPPNGDAQNAELGQVVIYLFGVPQVISLQQYEDSPFYEAP